MADQATYLIDSDVLITAKNLYYAFDPCPGFWKSLPHYHKEGQVLSVDKVRDELLIGRSDEDLFQWAPVPLRSATPGPAQSGLLMLK